VSNPPLLETAVAGQAPLPFSLSSSILASRRSSVATPATNRRNDCSPMQVTTAPSLVDGDQANHLGVFVGRRIARACDCRTRRAVSDGTAPCSYCWGRTSAPSAVPRHSRGVLSPTVAAGGGGTSSPRLLWLVSQQTSDVDAAPALGLLDEGTRHRRLRMAGWGSSSDESKRDGPDRTGAAVLLAPQRFAPCSMKAVSQRRLARAT
jgi:hypothetical protein